MLYIAGVFWAVSMLKPMILIVGILWPVIGWGREGGPWGDQDCVFQIDGGEKSQRGIGWADSFPIGWVPVLPSSEWN